MLTPKEKRKKIVLDSTQMLCTNSIDLSWGEPRWLASLRLRVSHDPDSIVQRTEHNHPHTPEDEVTTE